MILAAHPKMEPFLVQTPVDGPFEDVRNPVVALMTNQNADFANVKQESNTLPGGSSACLFIASAACNDFVDGEDLVQESPLPPTHPTHLSPSLRKSFRLPRGSQGLGS